MTGENAQRTLDALRHFYALARAPLSVDAIQLGLIELLNAPVRRIARSAGSPVDGPQLVTRKSELHGRTPRQVEYLKHIQEHDITFGIGPAGTGKTYLAVASAVDAFKRDLVERIILTRPAVEAGEHLGFLHGDLTQKIDPYLRPLYDALYDLMGADRVAKLYEKRAIEIAPLAFMRGRTLNHAFVILDEAQNTTPEQMKMFLTRIGIGAKAVVTGDLTQRSTCPRARRAACARRARSSRGCAAWLLPNFSRKTWCATRWSPASLPPMNPTPRKRLNLSVQYACNRAGLPLRADFVKWARAALAGGGEVTIRLVDTDEGQSLNREYRGKDYATNVLSFPYDSEPLVVGDLVICPSVVTREADEQGKPLAAHYAYLVVHGMLHLQGWDHDNDDDAEAMENEENRILAALGYPDPYAA